MLHCLLRMFTSGNFTSFLDRAMDARADILALKQQMLLGCTEHTAYSARGGTTKKLALQPIWHYIGYFC